MKFKKVLTNDGSNTLYLPDLDETYHSSHGALQESLHVYVDAGLRYLSENQDACKIFELGFGTGLNAYLTAYYSRQLGIDVFYKSIEKFPLSQNDYKELDYYELIEDELFSVESEDIAMAVWDRRVRINEFFEIKKVQGDFMDYRSDTGAFDLIYYDAFGHRAQSELWDLKPFQICNRILRIGGILVTYASKGSARRNLIEAGFEVEKIPGAPGKREMMRAIKVR